MDGDWGGVIQAFCLDKPVCGVESSLQVYGGNTPTITGLYQKQRPECAAGTLRLPEILLNSVKFRLSFYPNRSEGKFRNLGAKI